MTLYAPSGGSIVLWCHCRFGDFSNITGSKRKKANENTRQFKEEETDAIFKDLKEKHKENYDTPKLCLWARMIAANLHDDYDTPPDVPLISGSLPKKKKKDNMFDAITSAAEAFAKTVSTSTSNNPTPASNSCSYST